MSIQLRIDHVEGLKLRQQTYKDKLDAEPTVNEKGEKFYPKDWYFEPDDCLRDLDPRTREPTNHYTTYVGAHLKNLVLEKSGSASNLMFRNSSIRNQLRLRAQRKHKGKWITERDSYLDPNTYGGVYIGDGLRTIVDEVPT